MSDLIEINISSIFNIKKIIGEREVAMKIPSGSTVGRLLSIMVSRWGDEFADSIFEKSSGKLNPKVRLMENGRGIGLLDRLDAILQDGDHFLILPPVGGG